MLDKKKIKDIINDLAEIRKEERLDISDEILFRESCCFQRGLMIQNKRCQQQPINQITEKQRNFIKLNEKRLRKMGFDIDNIQNKSDAFKIISEFKKHE